jgi:iron-sulfur cluster repair protein YtfE (RIC family)
MAGTEPIDFTLMYVTHDAFRRDVARLQAAAAADATSRPGVLAGWANFKAQLTLHHTFEDTALWPRVEKAVRDEPDRLLLQEMEDEHAQLDPLLEAVDSALGHTTSGLLELTRQLQAVLDHHLVHEEQSALPMIQRLLTTTDWKAFAAAMRRGQGFSGAAVYTPWVIDELDSASQRSFWNVMPAPLRLVNRAVFQPRYDRRQLWRY